MKRVLIPFFSCLLVFALLLGSFGTAKAEVGDDPVVTPVSGDMEFTTEVIAIASLPGTTELNQMLVPVGFPDGEAQFEGAGVRVTGMDSGKATACFTLSTIAVNQGWGGKVGVWNGTKWVLLSTTITTGSDEAANTLACAPIAGNGTYAFIKWVTEPDKLPTTGACGAMTIAGPWSYEFNDYNGWMSEGAVITDYVIPLGTVISFQVINQDPTGFFTSGASANGIVTSTLVGPGLYLSVVTFDPDVIFSYAYWEDLNHFTFRVYLPNCYTDFVYPDDLFSS
jgi:hypothetical protein